MVQESQPPKPQSEHSRHRIDLVRLVLPTRAVYLPFVFAACSSANGPRAAYVVTSLALVVAADELLVCAGICDIIWIESIPWSPW
jgi:hypothetical protein